MSVYAIRRSKQAHVNIATCNHQLFLDSQAELSSRISGIKERGIPLPFDDEEAELAAIRKKMHRAWNCSMGPCHKAKAARALSSFWDMTPRMCECLEDGLKTQDKNMASIV